MGIRNLHWLKLNNYRNLDSGQTNLHDLNIFIGPNGSGKSNLINVFQFLKHSLIETESTRGISSFENAVQKFGNRRILDGTIEAPATVGIQIGFQNSERDADIVLDLDLLVQQKESQGVVINKEFLSNNPHDSANPYFFYKFHDFSRGSGVYSRYVIKETVDSSRTKFEHLDNVPANELMLFGVDKLLEDSKFAPDITPLYSERRRILDTVRQWQFYNANHMNLDEIRQAEPRVGLQDRFLAPDGTNLAAVLFNLGQLDWQFEDRINQALQAILPPTEKVRATTFGSATLNVAWHWKNVKEPFYLYDLSDGTVRMLCWALILLSPKLPTLLVIEEPEIGLHVSWLSTLADWIKTASKKCQVIVSTHSPSLLDQFTDQPENVFVFHPKDKEGIHYSISPLSKDRLKGWLADGWELGDLYRVGEPVIGGWPW